MKKVWTYSQLAHRAMNRASNNPAEFDKLHRDHGSDLLVKGIRVRWGAGGRRSVFEFKALRKSRTNGAVTSHHIASVYGNKRDGRMYSYWQFHLTPTSFRKREVEKFLPIGLRFGVKSNHTTTCTYHKADGTVDSVGYWIGGNRGKPGEPSKLVVYDDQTGELVDGQTVQRLQLDCGSQNAWYDLGWHPDSVSARRDWMESINTIPFVDARRMLTRADHAWRVASELTREYPDIKVMLMKPRAVQSKQRMMPSGRQDRFVTLLDPNAAENRGTDSDWYLPRVILYWLERQDSDGELRWTSIDMVVAPFLGYEAPTQWFKCGQDERNVLVQCETPAAKPVIEPTGGNVVAMRTDQVKAAIETKYVLDSLPML